MDQYIIIISVIGIAALGMAWMPAISKRTGISYAIIYMLAGVLIYLVFPHLLPNADPRKHQTYTSHLTELVVIISLMGTGIKIDRSFAYKTWKTPIRLVTWGMLGCIGIAALLGYGFFGMDVASALLLGAALAPTDPVLASDVQVGPPNEKLRFETKFALTAEAGMNDAFAFPFVMLAITMSQMANKGQGSIWEWAGYALILKVVIGLVIGVIIGRLLGYLIFSVGDRLEVLETRDGFVALSLTLMVYGITELAHGYGFMAVFVAGLSLRHYERGHKLHTKLHDFTDQTERIMVAIVLILFGGSLTTGILNNLTWPMVTFSILFLFIVRPLTSYLSLFGIQLHSREKWVISFFGIRGMGSIYYLSYAFKEAHFPYAEQIWTVVTFTILLSIFVHGLTATTVMKRMEARFANEIG
ncbi:sodium:proton antiporter [Mucilaginibacter sp. PAMB04168]|uniref:cation:proton antiporter n=1 Tax=Mucilaginibacter sp. PAMB04168 TaxID=3138567 RepID=UPI0031F6E391